jgi:predicted lipid-binding transport protein (Tim44 family)
MKKWLLMLGIALLGGALVLPDAEARRLGGARSLGAQRNVTPPPPPPARQAQPAAPAQQPAAAPAGTAAQPAAAGGSKWLPVLGGLAIGGFLGYLLSGSGLGALLLLALLAFGAVLAFRALARRRAEPVRPLQYAGPGNETVAAPPPSRQAGISVPGVSALPGSVPAGFDVDGFLRAAKLNFIRLQIANDRGRVDEIREFTTDALFEELRKDVVTRAASQQTDVVALNADLLELASEDGRHWASVRFSGMVQESPGAAPAGFEEVWNLVKPADGSSGWLLAGIQQLH